MKRDFVKRYKEYELTNLKYYGVFMKNGRARIDTKRYGKFFEIPNSKILNRNTVYYKPTKIHKNDYICNRFRMMVNAIKYYWYNEYLKAINSIKTPKEVEDDTRINYLAGGIFDFEEVNMYATIQRIKRISSYKIIIKSFYAQFFHQFVSQIDAISLKILSSFGYKRNYFYRKNFEDFIKDKQENNGKSLQDFDNYYIYDEIHCVWNFLKHNSISSYKALKKCNPNRIYDPGNKYKNGQLAITVLKIDKKYIDWCLNHICDFFDEVCMLAFKENVKDAQWDYDDYFLENANREIDF